MNDEFVQPSKFITPSTTRWLVKGKCIFSILTQWDELKAYFDVINDKDKNYHARVLCEMLADCRNFLYLTFVLPIIQDFEKVNAAFQASNTNPIKVFEDLQQLHKSLLVRLYEGGSTNSGILPLDQIDLGVKFDRELMKMKTRLSEEDVYNLKKRTYKNALDENCFEELAESALNAYCLPLSNATVERIFSHVTNVKTKLRNKLSTVVLSAIIRIKTSLHFSGNCCKDFAVTKRMLSLFNDSMYGASAASSSASTSSAPAGSHMSLNYTNEDFDEVIAVPFQ
ncbi:hypothetical protein Pcinc_000007 [Petrolisthes cinctipes]|uniref:HAT C-terminal dimerisation domain-containing protein n=1 Tax=Petrolisthes cinctipes TaxID=88211 RepID=A0AAE1GMZ8_PETCI|nr:hypothetical protein Pcinc_000007 [Petrolisthes cinctipes]